MGIKEKVIVGLIGYVVVNVTLKGFVARVNKLTKKQTNDIQEESLCEIDRQVVQIKRDSPLGKKFCKVEEA